VYFRGRPKDYGHGETRLIKAVDLNNNQLVTMWIPQWLFDPKKDWADVERGIITPEEYWGSAKMYCPRHYEIVQAHYRYEDDPRGVHQNDARKLGEIVGDFPIVANVKGSVTIKYVDEIKSVAQYSVPRTIHIELKDCRFGNGFVVHEPTAVVVPAPEGVAFDPLMNRIQPVPGSLTVKGTFFVYLRNIAGRFRRTLKPKDGTFELVDYDIQDLREAFEQYQLDQSYVALVDEIRAMLKEGKFLSPGDITALGKKRGFQIDDPVEFLRQETMRQEFRAEFVWWFDEAAEESYYGDGSFFFKIGDKWCWEVPVPGNATYIFDEEMPIGELSQKCMVTPRTVIMTGDAIPGYLGRVIHPGINGDEDHNDQVVELWKRRMEKALQ